MPDSPAETVAAPALPPGAAVDAAAVRAAGDRMVPLGQPIADAGEDTVRAWRWIGDYYDAPETPVLLAALDPVVGLTDTAAQRVLGLGVALRTWADGIEPIIEELRRLGASGRVTPADASRMTVLIGQLADAERACVNAMRTLTESPLEPGKIKTGEQAGERKATLSVGFVEFENGTGLKITTSSDGTVSATVVSAVGVGLAGSAGPVDLGGGVTFQSGSTWKFQDSDEAARLITELQRYVDARQRPTPAGKGSYPIGALLRPPRAPDLVVTESGLRASARAGIETPLAEAGITLEGKVKETVTLDRTNGTTQTSLTSEGTVAVDGRFAPLGVGPAAGAAQQDKIELGRSVTRDPAGKIIGLELTRTVTGADAASGGAAGPGDASGGRHRAPGVSVDGGGKGEHTESTVAVTTTTLEVNDGNRALVQRWVDAGMPDLGTPAGVGKVHRPDTAVPNDEFQNLLHREAQVGDVIYRETKDAVNARAEARAGGKVGAMVDISGTSSRAVSASHLGAATPDGVRHPVADPEDLTP